MYKRFVEFFEGTDKQLSFMRLAQVPSVLSCCFGIVYGAIKLNAPTIAASGIALAGILFTKAQQAKYEESSSTTGDNNV